MANETPAQPKSASPQAPISDNDYRRLQLKLLSRIAEGVEGIQAACEAIHAELVGKTDDELDAEAGLGLDNE